VKLLKCLSVFVSEDEIIQPRTILVAESCNTNVSLMFIYTAVIICSVVMWRKGSVCILGGFVCIDKLRPKMSPVGTSTTGSIVLRGQVQYLRINVYMYVCLSRIHKVFEVRCF
jgi:hypothetical protein